MSIRAGGFMAFVGPAPNADEDRSDYRPVPASDNGLTYTDRGGLGSYTPTDERRAAPAETRFFTGFAGDEADLRRGFCEPAIREDPAYDKNNYSDRWTQPMEPNEDMGETDVMRQDWEFRGRNQRSRGFLTRPRVPTERG